MLIIDQIRKNDVPLRHLSLGVLTGMGVLLVGLWYVQIASAGKYAEKEKGQSFRTIRIPAVRGKILDRNGVVLAEDRASYNLSIYMASLRPYFTFEYTNVVRPAFLRAHGGVKPKGKQLEDLELMSRYLVASNSAYNLGGLLRTQISLSEKQFLLHYERRPVLPLPVLENVSAAQVARFEEQPEHIQGMDVEAQTVRVYPFNTLAAHLLGYVTHDDSSKFDEESFYSYRMDDFSGVVGLERAYDEALRGRAGVKSVQVNRLGYRHAEQIETPAEAGSNVVLTLDYNIQKAAEEGLASHGSNTLGAVVVMDASNGDVLAMASSPIFDPNRFAHRLTVGEMEYLLDPKLEPQINRATMGIYPPGSIFKIITGLAAMEAGVLNPEETYESPGRYPLGKGIADTAAPGPYNFYKAFIKSCNCYFIEYGRRAGLARLQDMGSRFFLGQTEGLGGLRQESSGTFPTPVWIEKQRQQGEHWTEGNTAHLCFGQDRLTVTPLQMAVMTAAVANGGTIVWPRLVQRIEPQEKLPEGDSSIVIKNEVRGLINVNPAHLEVVRRAMLGDVEDQIGTAYAAFHKRGAPVLAGMRVAGKTGTATVDYSKRKIVWFASYAASEDPPMVVLVMVDYGSSGGGTCAPIALHVYQEIERLKRAPKSRTPMKGGIL